ncbi:MAG: Flp family type IVb pilin [Myxococcota bacterium]
MELRIGRLKKCEAGISAVEYLIAIGVVALVVIIGFSALGSAINAKAEEAGQAVNEQITFGAAE